MGFASPMSHGITTVLSVSSGSGTSTSFWTTKCREKPPLCLNSLNSHISKSRAKIASRMIALKRSVCYSKEVLKMAKVD